MPSTAEAVNIAAIVVAIAGLLAGVAGFALYWRERQRATLASAKDAAKRRLPREWPLDPRPLVSRAERRVWHWLRLAFPDHHVMIKLPLTRFTAPRERASASEWFDLLNGAYCTFTICNPKGRVIGCLDLIGPNGTQSSHRLKQALLMQCGIAYRVTAPDALPSPDTLRTEFLDLYDPDGGGVPSTEPGRLAEAAQHLHEALARERSRRDSGPQPLLPVANDDTFASDGHHLYQPQKNSFLASLDTRQDLAEDPPPARASAAAI